MRLTILLPLLVATLLVGPVEAQQSATPDAAALADMLEGDMQKLVFHSEPKIVPEVSFSDLEGGSYTLADFSDQIVVLNFWATWCAPCRKEMPALDRLNAELGGPDFQVLAVATGRNPPGALTRFFEETGVETLTLYNDPQQEMARALAVLGLPITVVLDREGREIARMRGDAEWDSESAKAMLQALIGRS